MHGTPSSTSTSFWRQTGWVGAATGASLLVLYFATVVWSPPFARDAHDYVVGRDFLNFWIYGRETWGAAPARFYDIALYNRHLAELVPWTYATQQWSYPPHILFFAAPFGLLPYGIAYVLWTALGVAAFWAAALDRDDGWREFAALALAPAALLCLVSGQNAFFTAAILIAVYRFIDARPLLIGALIGVLTVKPQLGLLLPLMLVLTGRWRVFLAAAATTIALVGASVLVFGADVWLAYLGPGVRLQEYVLQVPSQVVMGLMPTVFMNARVAGFGPEIAYAIQAVAALAAVATVIWTYARRRDPLLSYGVLLVATLVATPYLMSYDLVVMGWLALALSKTGRFPLPQRALLVGLYWLPFMALAMAVSGVPGSALIPAAALVMLILALQERDQAVTEPPAATVNERLPSINGLRGY
ncbi:MAG TPA: glycosyltransferase family 87 protein [Xanthobacteraceae bacterium]|nr:glycosyltransferase family 87 protein [Xanthobacteraceae bacterium]